jgi:hypothetical protein
MKNAGVDESLVIDAIRTIKAERVLPFRYVAAALGSSKPEAQFAS